MVSNISSKWRRRFQYIYKADKNSQDLYIPNIGFEDGIAIYTLITNSETGEVYRALELGSGVGYSTLWILYALEDMSVENTYLTAVEMDGDRARLLRQILEDVKPLKTRYNVIVDDAIQFINSLNDKYDFIFVDINKNRYIEALEKLGRVSHDKTIVLFHNAFIPAPPKEFIDKARQEGWKVNIIPTRVGLFLLKREKTI